MKNFKKVSVSFPNTPTNKVTAIKAVKFVTDWGLKESKNWVESNRGDIVEGIIPSHEVVAVKDLVDRAGGVFSDDTELSKYYDDFKEIAMKAMLADDTMAAQQILNFINESR